MTEITLICEQCIFANFTACVSAFSDDSEPSTGTRILSHKFIHVYQ